MAKAFFEMIKLYSVLQVGPKRSREELKSAYLRCGSAQVPPALTKALVQSSKTALPSSKLPSHSSKAPPPTSGKTSSQSSKRPPPASSQTAIFGQQPWSASFLEMSTPDNPASVREIAFFLDGPVGTGRLHPPTSAALKLVPRPGTSWSTSGPGAFRDFFVPKTSDAESVPCALRTVLPTTSSPRESPEISFRVEAKCLQINDFGAERWIGALGGLSQK